MYGFGENYVKGLPYGPGPYTGQGGSLYGNPWDTSAYQYGVPSQFGGYGQGRSFFFVWVANGLKSSVKWTVLHIQRIHTI